MKTTIDIALIDDEPFLSNSLKMCLEMQCGNKIRIKTFESAIQFLEDETSFDIVLSDYNMPQLSGIELAKKLCYPQKNIKRMVIMTGCDNVPSEYVNKELVDLVVEKPFDFELLHKLFDDVLAES